MSATERAMLDLIAARHADHQGHATGMPPRYLVIEQPSVVGVNTAGNGQLRTLDALVLDRYKVRGHREVHGFEVKVSRSDWLRELRDRTKAGAWEAYCHRFWLAVPDPDIVRPDELPPGWGMLAPTDGELLPTRPAKLKKHPQPLDNLGDLIWQAIKTDRRHHRRTP